MKHIRSYLLLLICAGLIACDQTDQTKNPTPSAAETGIQDLATRAGAPLFEGMGEFSMPITTADPDAQRYFDQGMILAFAFNHAESVRSFKAAQTLDPSCSMCFWGEALAIGPNINVTSKGKVIMSPAERTAAFSAITQALTLASGASPREQAYIQALASRYNGDPDTPRAPLDEAWAQGMGKVSETYPNDLTAAAIHAEALMNTMPWNYWSDDLKAKPATQVVIANLERVLEGAPDHPLAQHLYIHALEASSTPEKAEAVADRLTDLVPGAGHLVHMPAHIFYRVGRYNDAAEANIRAAAVDEAYIAQCNAQGFYPAAYYPHNIHFLWSSATMQGQRAVSLDSAQRVVDNVRVEQVKQFPTIEFFRTVPLLSMVRFGQWQTILSEPQPFAEFRFAEAIWRYARGVAFAATGEVAAARAELAQLEPLQADVAVTFLDKRDYPGSVLVGIAINLLKGEIAYRQSDYAGAVPHFERAVAAQDLLPYTEPPFWYYPTRQSLGAALLKAGKPVQAEAVYRADLKQYRHNGWSMFGLMQSLEAQGKTAEAAKVKVHFDAAWQFADTELEASIL
jgi:tetratricopeptide (TPR) repeat protein